MFRSFQASASSTSQYTKCLVYLPHLHTGSPKKKNAQQKKANQPQTGQVGQVPSFPGTLPINSPYTPSFLNNSNTNNNSTAAAVPINNNIGAAAAAGLMMPPIGGNSNALLGSPHSSSYMPLGALGALGSATSHLGTNGQMQPNKNIGGMPSAAPHYGMNVAGGGGRVGSTGGAVGAPNVNTGAAAGRKMNQPMGTSLLNSQSAGLPHAMNNKNGLWCHNLLRCRQEKLICVCFLLRLFRIE